MKYALKEWNTTIEALGKGLVIALWRKGGLQDKSKNINWDFSVEQKQFVLFPTFTHQELQKLKQDFYKLYEENSYHLNNRNQIKIKYWAELEECISIDRLDQILSISKELVNSNEYLKSSWNLYPDHQGKVLLLRVYALSNPILILNSPDYAGCKSWLDLNIDVPKAHTKPVLSFKDFSQRVRYIKALLEQEKELMLASTKVQI